VDKSTSINPTYALTPCALVLLPKADRKFFRGNKKWQNN
jgi:hypothetical protein